MNCKFKTIGENHHKCEECGYELKGQQDPSRIFRKCSKVVQEMPSLIERGGNFIDSMIQYAQDGFQNVSDEEHDKRMAICNACEFFQAGTCQKCGCSCNFKSRMKVMKCPIGKW